MSRRTANRGHSATKRHPAHKPLKAQDWISRLDGKVTIDINGCWIFGDDPTSYRQVWAGDRQVPAHRMVYELMVGDLVPGHHVHHECETPACINPDHLVQLSPAEHRRRHAGDQR